MVRRNKYYFLLATLLLCSATVCFLLFFSADLPNKLKNGFARKLLSEVPIAGNVKHIGEGATVISGFTENCIFISGDDPSWVLRLGKDMLPIDTLGYGIRYTEKLRAPAIRIDSPNLYMYANEIPMLIKGNVDSARIDTVRLRTDLITRVVQISPQRLAIRGIDSTQSRQVFKIINAENGEVLRQADLIESQQFGGFDSDGYFRYDKVHSKLFYILMFQNKIFCIDTLLNIDYTAHTIDTTFVNKVNIDIVTTEHDSKVMATTPRQIVNKIFDVDENTIYVISGLRGDNESLKDFNSSYSIDMYNSSNGKYLSSFQVKRFNGKTFRDFRIDNNRVYLLYEGGWLAIYPIPNH